MQSWNTEDKIKAVRNLSIITGSIGMGIMIYILIMIFIIEPTNHVSTLNALSSLNYPLGFSGMCLMGISLYLQSKVKQLERMNK